MHGYRRGRGGVQARGGEAVLQSPVQMLQVRARVAPGQLQHCSSSSSRARLN